MQRYPLAQNTSAAPVSWTCHLCSHTGPHTWTGPVLGLMFCCHHFEILDSLCTRSYIFPFCSGPCQWWWPPLGWGRGGTVLLGFTTQKVKPLGWVPCEILSLVSQKPFPLFSSQLCPWVWQLGVHWLLYWISCVHFLLTLDVFTTAKRGLLASGPNLLLPPWIWLADSDHRPPQGTTLTAWNLLCHWNVTCLMPLCSLVCFSFCLECSSVTTAHCPFGSHSFRPVPDVIFCIEPFKHLRQKSLPTGPCSYGSEATSALASNSMACGIWSFLPFSPTHHILDKSVLDLEYKSAIPSRKISLSACNSFIVALII